MLSRCYQNPLPNVQDFVVVGVKELNENTIVKVELLEYGGVMGIIFQKQLITQKKETITQALSKLGRNFVLQVSKIDITTGAIDLDKLQVTEDIEKHTLKIYSDNKVVYSFVQALIFKFKKEQWGEQTTNREEQKKMIEQTYEETIWKPLDHMKKLMLARNYPAEDLETYLQIITNIVQDDELLQEYLRMIEKFDYYKIHEFKDLLLKRFQQQPQHFTMAVEISSTYSVLGVTAIKSAAEEAMKITQGWQYGNDEQPLKVTIITPPKYTISTVLKNPKIAEQRIQDFYNQFEANLKIYGGTIKKDKLQSQAVKDGDKKKPEKK